MHERVALRLQPVSVAQMNLVPDSVRLSQLQGWKNELPVSVAADMNTSVDPCVDFYQFSCGNFIHRQHIPADMSVFARAWDGAGEEVAHKLKVWCRVEACSTVYIVSILIRVMSIQHLLETDTHGAAGRYFSACMDLKRIKAVGAKPMQRALARVQQVHDLRSFISAVGTLSIWDVTSVFAWWCVVCIYLDLSTVPPHALVSLAGSILILPTHFRGYLPLIRLATPSLILLSIGEEVQY